MRHFLSQFFIVGLAYFAIFSAVGQITRSQASPRQKENPANSNRSLTGHYEGTATGKTQQIMSLAIDVIDTGGALSGRINTTFGVFPIVSGIRQDTTLSITFDENGELGHISGQITDNHFVGTFSLGDEGGPVNLKKTFEVPRSAAGKSSLATPILFLGVYHMHNPGLDEVNTQADDVLAPKRQQEIEELASKLARFRPTKIAVECPYRDTYWPTQYQKFLDGQYALGRNEIEQIGFRLAKNLHLPTLHCIDFQMFMNGLTPSEMAESKPGKTEPNATAKAEPMPLSPEDERLRRSTVVEYLAHLNSTVEIQKNHEEYMNNLLPTDDPAIYRKADMVSNWYKRNLRIFANINRITEPGKDRILVIIGAGHLKLLKEFAADAPYFDEMDVESFLQ